MIKFARICKLLVFVLLTVVLLPTEVKADEGQVLSFKLHDDGKSYYVRSCSPSSGAEVVIPDSYNGLPVTGIGAGAFRHCEELVSVTIPEGVTYLGENKGKRSLL